jgi:hypothetical protein
MDTKSSANVLIFTVIKLVDSVIFTVIKLIVFAIDPPEARITSRASYYMVDSMSQIKPDKIEIILGLTSEIEELTVETFSFFRLF